MVAVICVEMRVLDVIVPATPNYGPAQAHRESGFVVNAVSLAGEVCHGKDLSVSECGI